MPKTERKEKRRGGVRDDSEIYISYTRSELSELLGRIRKRCEYWIAKYEAEERKQRQRP